METENGLIDYVTWLGWGGWHQRRLKEGHLNWVINEE